MTREQFSNIAKGLKAVYSRDKFMVDKDAFDMWYALLSEYDYNAVSLATKNYMSTEKYPPVPADIIDKIHSVVEIPTIALPHEAWIVVRKAISRGNYYAQEEFDKLPPIIQKVVGSANMIKEYAKMDEDKLDTVIYSQFIRAYTAEIERQKNVSRMPSEIKNQIEQKRQEMLEQKNV